MSWSFEEMDRLFNPKAVAVVGDRGPNFGWLNSAKEIKGKLYSVHINEEEAKRIEEKFNIKSYKSLVDIPDKVDYVIVNVPRTAAATILRDGIQKGVEGIMYFTAGFAEMNTEEGVRLQKELTEIALKGRMKIVGPNCMGLFNPKVGIRQNQDQYVGESGPVGFISQSGTHAISFSMMGYRHGIRISKSASMGNGITVNATDYLEYMGQDPETRIIGMYIEGVEDGRRFFRVLRDVAARKPVLIWKGGRTEDGARAVLSHTASLAASQTVWDAMIKQSGAIRVDNLEEMVDTVKGLLYIKPSTGKRMGLGSMSGGQSVSITDTFSGVGLSVPRLTQRSYKQFSEFFNLPGGSYQNPLDMTSLSMVYREKASDYILQAMELLGGDENVDAVVYELQMGSFRPRNEEATHKLLGLLTEYRQRLSKPFFCVITAFPEGDTDSFEARKRLLECGIASYSNFHRAATTYRRLAEHYRAQQEIRAS